MEYIKNFDEFHQTHCIIENELIKNELTPINIGEITLLNTPEEIEMYSPLVWDMLETSYKNIGGLQSYRDFKDFKKKKHLIMIVKNFNTGDLLACATFRRIENSLKMTAIGCNQEDNGKLALQQIIQHTVSDLNLHYWAEVSGAIEHYFKKYNGYPMPNVMASKILQISESQIILSKKDMVHYDRSIGQDNEVFTKMIFGIKSEEIFQEALSVVENYYDFMKEVNKMINESIKTKYSVKQAIYIIENLYRLHEENGVNELTPNWNNALKESMKTLTSIKEKTQTIYDYIEYGNYLLSDMQPLVLHKLNL